MRAWCPQKCTEIAKQAAEVEQMLKSRLTGPGSVLARGDSRGGKGRDSNALAELNTKVGDGNMITVGFGLVTLGFTAIAVTLTVGQFTTMSEQSLKAGLVAGYFGVLAGLVYLASLLVRRFCRWVKRRRKKETDE